jgi:hypothetical protein
MNTLQAELRRLYLPDDSNSPNASGDGPGLIASDGRVRALVLELARPADWSVLSAVWQGVQADLQLPAPAVAASGIDGYQLWFSLVQSVSVDQAITFLESLRRRYLGAIAPERIGLMPSATRHPRMVPALQGDTGRWSAFVAPDLAAIFSDAPWLDVCPSPEAQANVLSRLASIEPAAFQAALDGLGPVAEPQAGGADRHAVAEPVSHGNALDPQRFLRDVMNDPAVALHLRIEAAKALLPYGDGKRGA